MGLRGGVAGRCGGDDEAVGNRRGARGRGLPPLARAAQGAAAARGARARRGAAGRRRGGHCRLARADRVHALVVRRRRLPRAGRLALDRLVRPPPPPARRLAADRGQGPRAACSARRRRLEPRAASRAALARRGCARLSRRGQLPPALLPPARAAAGPARGDRGGASARPAPASGGRRLRRGRDGVGRARRPALVRRRARAGEGDLAPRSAPSPRRRGRGLRQETHAPGRQDLRGLGRRRRLLPQPAGHDVGP